MVLRRIPGIIDMPGTRQRPSVPRRQARYAKPDFIRHRRRTRPPTRAAGPPRRPPAASRP
jgi:hypothetical protein